MLYEYELKIANLYNIPIGNVKKLVSSFLVKKSMCLVTKNYNFTED